MGFGYVLAQTSTGINIGDALVVTKSGVRISKPITAGQLTLTLPVCGLLMGCDFVTSFPQSIATDNESVTVPTEPFPRFSFIRPTVDKGMDLGGSTKYFRNLYVSQPYQTNSARVLSDVRYKENIKTLQDATQIISQLRPVSFDLKYTDSTADTSNLKNKVGFIAQEVQEILPHSVSYIQDVDIYTMDYTSVIPYLTRAFQESQEEKAELEEQVAELQQQLQELQLLVQSILNENTDESVPNFAPKNGGKRNSGEKSDSQQVKLFQNVPNPYSSGTIIRYELAKTKGKAYICIYDIKGRMVQNIALAHTQGVGTVEISEGILAPGTYTYSLVVSGQLMDSKRMVVAE